MPNTNERLAELWIDALVAERGVAALTIDSYRNDLTCYFGYLDEQGLALADVADGDLVAFLADLTRRAFAPATIAHRRSVVMSLHRFLHAEGQLPRDPGIHLDPARRWISLPFVLRIDEVDALLDVAHAKAADASFGLYRQAGHARRAALLETLYASGMRVSEAIALPYSAIKSGSTSTVIRGKGSKDRLVMLTERALLAITHWRDLASTYGSVSDRWVFHPTRSGERHLTRRAALDEIKQAAVDADIHDPSRVSPHKLRHAFATHLLGAGVDLRSLQEMLGHADLGSTQIYTHVDMSRANAMVFDLHPLSDRASTD